MGNIRTPLEMFGQLLGVVLSEYQLIIFAYKKCDLNTEIQKNNHKNDNFNDNFKNYLIF